MNYSTKDIFLARRTENQTFEEYQLHVQPNSMVVSDATGNLAMIDSSSFIASYAVSASYAPNLYPQVAQVTVPSASWVSASVFVTTAQTASYVATASFYPQFPNTIVSASWVSASVHIINSDTASCISLSNVQISNGNLQLYNTTNTTWYNITISGSTGAETIVIGQ